MYKALFYEKLDMNRVKCRLCPHGCIISPEGKGICRQRTNLKGELYSSNYGKISSYGNDPIEKKPLYHFYPGESIISAGTAGCNLKCEFCQNWSIAHNQEVQLRDIDSHTLLYMIQKENAVGAAYTYNEPVIWYEFVFNTAGKLKEKGLKNVLVTNGFIEKEPLKQIMPFIDAFNIDVKSFNDEYYKKICGGTLKNVLKTVEIAAESSHIEITNLIVKGLNDTEKEIKALTKWIESVNKNIPLHMSRYYPNYRMTREATPVSTLRQLREVARENLDYVYVGNVWGEDNNTYCPDCTGILIERAYTGNTIGIKDNRCIKCGYHIYGCFQ